MPSDPSLDVGNNGYFVSAWVDRREGKKAVYSQIYNDLIQPVGSNTPVSSAGPELMVTPSTSALNGRAWYAWADPRSNGMNIYANNVVYLPTDADDNNEQLPDDYSLAQNYPNPFNPSTVISFNLPEKNQVKLVIYNMLGQVVSVLADKEYSAGMHQLIWDGTSTNGQKVSSGMYLYRLSSGDFEETRKMIMLK